MQSEFSCEQCKEQLPSFVDGNLTSLQQQRLDQHLGHCEACNETLAQLWELQAFSSRWHDEPVPGWSRRKTFFTSNPLLFNIQWISSFASVLVLVLVVSQAQISMKDGISFGTGTQVTRAELDNVLTSFEQSQKQQLEARVTSLANQQMASNQLMLRTVLSMSREERKEELTTLLTAWDYAQDQRTEQTEESIRLLLASQVEDKRNIDQINRLLKQAVLEGSDL